jgi:hypothetical protein
MTTNNANGLDTTQEMRSFDDGASRSRGRYELSESQKARAGAAGYIPEAVRLEREAILKVPSPATGSDVHTTGDFNPLVDNPPVENTPVENALDPFLTPPNYVGTPAEYVPDTGPDIDAKLSRTISELEILHTELSTHEHSSNNKLSRLRTLIDETKQVQQTHVGQIQALAQGVMSHDAHLDALEFQVRNLEHNARLLRDYLAVKEILEQEQRLDAGITAAVVGASCILVAGISALFMWIKSVLDKREQRRLTTAQVKSNQTTHVLMERHVQWD